MREEELAYSQKKQKPSPTRGTSCKNSVSLLDSSQDWINSTTHFKEKKKE